MEGNASGYQVHPANRLAGEGRAEFLRAWGPGLEQEGAGGGGRRGNSICAWKLPTSEPATTSGFEISYCDRIAIVLLSYCYHAAVILQE